MSTNDSLPLPFLTSDPVFFHCFIEHSIKQNIVPLHDLYSLSTDTTFATLSFLRITILLHLSTSFHNSQVWMFSLLFSCARTRVTGLCEALYLSGSSTANQPHLARRSWPVVSYERFLHKVVKVTVLSILLHWWEKMINKNLSSYRKDNLGEENATLTQNGREICLRSFFEPAWS
jgi:hypothetical protein